MGSSEGIEVWHRLTGALLPTTAWKLDAPLRASRAQYLISPANPQLSRAATVGQRAPWLKSGWPSNSDLVSLNAHATLVGWLQIRPLRQGVFEHLVQGHRPAL